MPIYTKFGDKGATNLLGSGTVPKSHPRVEAYGEVDELNSVLGIAIAFSEKKDVTESLKRIQKDLFVIGAELASKDPKVRKIHPSRASELEKDIDELEAALPPLKNFIIPGGSKTASLLHHGRTVCRRAERRVVHAAEKEKINPSIIVYLNRVGDYLFMLARHVNYKKKVEETIWKGR
ncbi:cob(I)yrinic acid a,c-diamide adenosyltransferase [Candidatus Micrarchaeota archaeon]|nr:cob(I)yrinic acid a,c-diamide adenosyltransferase [Candidatus Micrarchaeota archaeon]